VNQTKQIHEREWFVLASEALAASNPAPVHSAGWERDANVIMLSHRGLDAILTRVGLAGGTTTVAVSGLAWTRHMGSETLVACVRAGEGHSTGFSDAQTHPLYDANCGTTVLVGLGGAGTGSRTAPLVSELPSGVGVMRLRDAVSHYGAYWPTTAPFTEFASGLGVTRLGSAETGSLCETCWGTAAFRAERRPGVRAMFDIWVTAEAGGHSPTPINADQFVSYSAKFGHANWDGYGADPIEPSTIEAARSFMAALPTAFGTPDVAPGADGTIGLEWAFPQWGVRKLFIDIGPGNVWSGYWRRFSGERSSLPRQTIDNATSNVLNALFDQLSA
jgi:hypothetical protein